MKVRRTTDIMYEASRWPEDPFSKSVVCTCATPMSPPGEARWWRKGSETPHHVHTQFGPAYVAPGDWIIIDCSSWDVSICKPHDFNRMYESVPET